MREMRAGFAMAAAIALLLYVGSVGVVGAKSDRPAGGNSAATPPTPATVQGTLVVQDGETVIRGTLNVRGSVIVEEGGTLIVRRVLNVDGTVTVDGTLDVGTEGRASVFSSQKPDTPPGRANRPEVTPSGTIPATPASNGTPAIPAQPGRGGEGYILIDLTFGGIGCTEGVNLTPALLRKIFDDWDDVPVGCAIGESEDYILYPAF